MKGEAASCANAVRAAGRALRTVGRVARLGPVPFVAACFFSLEPVRGDTISPDASISEDGAPDGASKVDGPVGDAPVSTYRAAVMASTPSGYWRLGDGAGGTAIDETGVYPGTYSEPGNLTFGTPGLLVGDPNTAVTFGTSPAVVAVPSFPELTGKSAVSLEVWFKCADLGATYRILLTQREVKGDTGIWLTYRQNSVGLVRRVAGAELRAEGAMSDATHHLVGTYDGSSLRVYLDGTLLDTAADTRAFDVPAPKTFIGAGFSDGSQRFIGTVDEAAIYARALDASEIQAHYTAGTK